MPRVIDLDTALTDDQPLRYRTIAVDVESGELVGHLYTDRRPTPGQIVQMLRSAPLDADGVILRQDVLSTAMLRRFGKMQFRSPAWVDVRDVIDRHHRELAEREADARTSVPPNHGGNSGRDRELDVRTDLGPYRPV